MNIFTLTTTLLAALATVGLGAMLLRSLGFRGLPLSLAVGASYGIGVVIIGKGILWASYAGFALSVASYAATLAGLLAGSWLVFNTAKKSPHSMTGWGLGARPTEAASLLPMYKDPIIVCLLFLMSVHVAITLGNNFTRPVFPWDAFTTWMYRAKAWALQDFITPMTSVREWMTQGGASGYALYAHHYPTALSIYAAFASSLSGGWNSAAASAPWTLCFVTLCTLMHGIMTLAGATRRSAFLGAYLLCSLPLLNIHAALAGYGDLWMALFSGGGLALLLVWRTKQANKALWLALLLLLAGTQIKTEGWLWLMLGVGFVLLEGFARQFKYRWLFACIALLAATLWMTGVTHLSLGPLGDWGLTDTHLHAGVLGQFTLRPYNPAVNYFDILFQQANFLLLASAYAVALLVLAPLCRKEATPFWLMGALIALSQIIIFGLSSYSEYAETGTAITRLLIHFAPVAVVTIVLAWQAVATAVRNKRPAIKLNTPEKKTIAGQPRMILVTFVALTIAIISPAAVLLTPFGSKGDQDALVFEANDFVTPVGQSITTDQGLQFTNSPINVGVLKAQLKNPSQRLPRYLTTHASMKNPRDAAFYWIVEGTTDVQSISLVASGTLIEDLHQYPNWQNQHIQEIGFLVQAEKFATTHVRGLMLQESLGIGDAANLAGQWLKSEPSSQRLINNSLGHIDTPINRNAWLNISLIIALLLVGGALVFMPVSWALNTSAVIIVALWALSDLASVSASASVEGGLMNSERLVALNNPAEKLLGDVMSQLNGPQNKGAPVLLIPTGVNSQFAAQKAPFDLLPRRAVHTNRERARAVASSWEGHIVVLGSDRARTAGIARNIVGDDTSLSQSAHDGFVLISDLPR